VLSHDTQQIVKIERLSEESLGIDLSGSIRGVLRCREDHDWGVRP